MRDKIKAIIFDADDTLWSNEPRFRAAEQRVGGLLKEFCDIGTMSETLYGIEVKNMEDYGFGAKAFTLSMLETAVQLSGGRLNGAQTAEIIEIGREVLHNPAVPLDGVEETLKTLKASGKYKLVVMTKGELLDQEHKLQRSGLLEYFSHVEVVSDKNIEEYKSLCQKIGVSVENLMTVGNSFKSDIAPVLELGGWGVHIPFHVLWELEKTEEYDHGRLYRIDRFEDLLGITLCEN